MLTKHFTAFSRQVREGVIINKMAKENDLILNSKREVVGNRITRKRVLINGEPLDLLIGDTSSLEPQERKLLAELEEGGEDYIDRELWIKVTSGGKRKMAEARPEKPEVSLEVIIEDDQKPKRQKLMTDYQIRLEVEQEQEKESQVTRAEAGSKYCTLCSQHSSLHPFEKIRAERSFFVQPDWLYSKVS